MKNRRSDNLRTTIRRHLMPAVIATAIIFVVFLVYAGNKIFQSSFVQDFTSNFLSTLLGVIIGIPIALWTADHQEHATEQTRKAKILSLLQEELILNLTYLYSWQNASSDRRQEETVILGSYLSDGSWRSFSDGGELQWLKDPTLLSQLSWTYSSIRTVRYLLEKYDSALKSGLYAGMAPRHIYEMLEKRVAETYKSIEIALHFIDKHIPAKTAA